jgi:hypothetical protein
MKKFNALPWALMVSAFALGIPAAANAATQETTVYRWQTFNEWDANQDGFIEAPEYQDYAFGIADIDRDGRLQDNEWTTYTRTFYDPVNVGYNKITYYDADGDGFVERKEFQKLSAAEGERSLYRMWDYDRDNRVSPDDWKRVTTYYVIPTRERPLVVMPPQNYND